MYILDEDMEDWESDEEYEESCRQYEKHLQSERRRRLFQAVDTLLNVDSNSSLSFYYSYFNQQVTGKGMLL